MESAGNTSDTLLDAFDPSLAAVPVEVDPSPYAYYGTTQEVVGYDAINTIVVADHSGTLFMEFSMDNTVWDVSFAYQYPDDGANLRTAMYKSVPTLAKFYRSGFINTSDYSQNLFRIQTLMHENTRQLSSQFDSVAISSESFDQTNELLTTINTTLSGTLEVHDSSANDTLTDINTNITSVIDGTERLHVYDSSINTILTTINSTLDSVTVGTELFYVYDSSANDSLSTLAACVSGSTMLTTVPAVNQVGSKGNIISSGAMSALASTTPINISSYGNTVIAYEDENVLNTGDILVFASPVVTAGSYVCIGVLTPISSANGAFRYAFDVMNLAPFNWLYIYNNSTTDNNTAVTCSLYSS